MCPENRSGVKVTVLMTLFNKGPYVAEAVRSILDGTFNDLELLVVDDASTDGGADIVRGIDDARVRLLESGSNSGRASAANRGYNAAKGEYIAVLDADDIAHPDRLAQQVAFMDANPEVGACGSWLQAFGSNGTLLRFPPSDLEARVLMLFGTPVSYGACMFRRSVLEAHQLRCDPTWLHPGMDYLFMLKVGLHTRYANLQLPLTRYRKGVQNMRHGRDEISDALVLWRAVLDLFGIGASAEQVRLHVFLLDMAQSPPTAGEVRLLYAWKNELLRINSERRTFPEAGFATWVERRWDTWFHTLVRRDALAAYTHMRASGRVRERAGYLAMFTLRRWFGGSRTGS